MKIQYSINGSGGIIQINKDCLFFSDISVKKDQRTLTKKTSCPFKRNNISCDGGSQIGRITNYQTNVISYFIGCNKYQKNERWYRFIKVKPDEINISLLQNIFAGFISEQTKTSQCNMIVLKFANLKYNRENFFKRILSEVKNNLQSLIKQVIHENDIITPRSLLSGNLIKVYFNKETLAEVHVSFNNIDKLCYLMGKVYKTLHSFGQGIIDVYHNVSNANSDLIHYIHKIAKKLIILEWFQIDVSFKHVKGEINEFEINTYDSNYHLILSLCRIFTNIFTAEEYHRLFSLLFKTIYEMQRRLKVWD
ncbi:hypothetical protein RhiirA4_478531 [Rhizophagus irregularis]|uniref:Uncharacterized protein n=1 Tax=Rhizophagus irregularis TaxID=588596 RepID=A0A2I1HF30_9GLOM|nr:hypothetical protein RhiirA4_478531 [Rhizophagus irregularis]